MMTTGRPWLQKLGVGLLAAVGFLLVLGSLQAYAQNYVGSGTCKTCHQSIWDDYMKSGHPWKIQKVEGAPPTYPEGTSPGVPNPPADKTWNDITYVIGGYGWKARFMDAEGYILTGDSIRQYNLPNENLGTEAGWVGYDADKAPRKPYTCGSCHTTGWVGTGESGPHQDNLPGIYGTWVEEGVRCEACHGPASEHVSAPLDSTKRPSTEERCGECHARGDVNQIDAKGGLIKHHEQYEDLLASPHKIFECGRCHEPHKSTKYHFGGYKGDDRTCKVCHSDKEIKIQRMANLECHDCHMPYVAKSAVAITVQTGAGPVPKGDIRTHIFRISDDPDWKMFTDDGKYVRLDADGKAHLELKYVCLTCHTSHDVAWAAQNAEAVHSGASVVEADEPVAKVPDAFALYQNYPNPFNPTTTIAFDLKETSVVKLTLHTVTGKQIAVLTNERLPAGHHEVTFSAEGLPSGVYIYRIQAGAFTANRKLTLLK